MKRPTYLSQDALNQFIQSALHEDIRDGDHSSHASIPFEAENKAQLIIKDTGIVAGIEMAEIIIDILAHGTPGRRGGQPGAGAQIQMHLAGVGGEIWRPN